MRKKSLIRMGAGVTFAFALACSLCQPVVAGVVMSGTGILPSNSGGAGTTLTVDYSVSESVLGIYTYSYVINNPSTDTTSPDQFSVSFNAVLGGNVIATSGGSGTIVNPGSTVTWFLNPVAPGGSSGTLSFTSRIFPTLGNAGANDHNPPAPWSTTNPGGQLVAVPVPEPTTMVAGALLLLPFGASTLRIFRKNRVA